MTSPVQEVRTFAATIPANTPQTSPAIVPITMPAREVAWVKWRVPPGPVGLMGWRLSMSNGQVLLPAGGGYIVTDNDGDTWTLYDQPDSGAWEVTGYNTDIYDHTVYLDFGVTVPGSAPAPVSFIPSSSISQPVPVSVPSALTVPPITIPAITVPQPVTVPGG
jgi:hypothetical protein